MKNIQQYIVLLLMAMLLVPQSLQAQEDKKLIIKGVVEDALGPIIGASVVAKNQPGVGAITDLDGRFSLKVGACCKSHLWAISRSKFRFCLSKIRIILR